MVKENKKIKLSDVNSVVEYLNVNKMQMSSKVINTSKQKEKTIPGLSSFNKEEISAINYFSDLIKQESFIKKLYVKHSDDWIVFWTVFDVNNNLFDKIDKLSGFELKLWDKFRNTDVKFGFQIMPDGSDYLKSIDNSTIKLFEK